MNKQINLTRMNEEMTKLLLVKERVDKLVDASMRLQKLHYEQTKKSVQVAKYGWLRIIAHPDYNLLDKDFEEASVEYDEARLALCEVIDVTKL